MEKKTVLGKIAEKYSGNNSLLTDSELDLFINSQKNNSNDIPENYRGEPVVSGKSFDLNTSSAINQTDTTAYNVPSEQMLSNEELDLIINNPTTNPNEQMEVEIIEEIQPESYSIKFEESSITVEVPPIPIKKESLLDGLLSDDPSIRKKAQEQVDTLKTSEIFFTTQYVDYLISSLNKISAQNISTQLIKLIGFTGDKRAVPFLMDALKYQDPSIISSIATVLGKMKAKEAVDKLLLFLENHIILIDPKTTITLIDALGKIGDTKALDKLNFLSTNHPLQIIMQHSEFAIKQIKEQNPQYNPFSNKNNPSQENIENTQEKQPKKGISTKVKLFALAGLATAGLIMFYNHYGYTKSTQFIQNVKNTVMETVKVHYSNMNDMFYSFFKTSEKNDNAKVIPIVPLVSPKIEDTKPEKTIDPKKQEQKETKTTQKQKPPKQSFKQPPKDNSQIDQSAPKKQKKEPDIDEDFKKFLEEQSFNDQKEKARGFSKMIGKTNMHNKKSPILLRKIC